MNKAICKLALTFSVGLSSAHAQVSISDAWVAATVTVQKSSAAFMKLKSQQALTLIGASSPVAGLVEAHSMNMTNGIMQMRPVGNLDLPAGQTVELSRSGTHLMMMGLKQQLKPGQSIPITLSFETVEKNGQKKKIEQQLMVPVRNLTDTTAQAPEQTHKH